MTITQLPQPALLYLVPGCVFSTVVYGFITGGLGDVVKFNEDEAFKDLKVLYSKEEAEEEEETAPLIEKPKTD